MSDRSFDSAHFRHVLGHLPTGVCVVASLDHDGPAGVAIGSFFSVSLEPPLVGFCVGHASSTWPRIRETGRFCVNVLGAHQEALVRAFSAKGADKFAGVSWDSTPLGSPRLVDAIAWIDCEVDAIHPAGDHDIVVGAVHHLDVAHDGRPLVFARGLYHQPDLIRLPKVHDRA